MTFAHRPSFINDEAFAKLLANGHCTAGGESIDPIPVVKLFLSGTGATWLLTELDPEDDDLAFGLCDLGAGFPELGHVRLSELASVRNRLGLPVERDEHFIPNRPLSAYAAKARADGMIRT